MKLAKWFGAAAVAVCSPWFGKLVELLIKKQEMAKIKQ